MAKIALILWFADISSGLMSLLRWIFWPSVIMLCVGIGFGLMASFGTRHVWDEHGLTDEDGHPKESKERAACKAWSSKIKAASLRFAIISMVIYVFIPSKNTIIVFAGATTVDQILASPDVQSVGGDVLTLVKKRLKDMIGEEEPPPPTSRSR